MTAVGNRGDAKPTLINTASFWSTTSQPARIDVMILVLHLTHFMRCMY